MIYKINKNIITEALILNNFIKKSKMYLKNIFDFGRVQDSILNKLLKAAKISRTSKTSKAKKNLEESSFKAASKVQGEINITDTCFTAAMKMINREKIIPLAHYSGEKFIKLYEKNGGELIKIDSKIGSQLKKGHLILLNLKDKKEPGNFAIFNNKFTEKHGVHRSENSPSGYSNIAHFGIVVDPVKYLILHNTGGDLDKNGKPTGVASTLRLRLESVPMLFKGKAPSAYVLDIKILDKIIKKNKAL